MKVRHKLASGFIVVASLVWMIGISAIIVSKNNLEKTIIQYSTASLSRITHYVDKETYSKAEYFLGRTKGAMLQKIIAESNTTLSKTSNPHKFISETDAEWKRLFKDSMNFFFNKLINSELNNAFTAEIQVFEKEYKQKIITEILVTDSLGALVSQTGKASDYYQADEFWWQRAKEDGVFITEFTYDSSSKVYAMEICIRVEDHTGRFIGVLKAVVSLENFLNSIRGYLKDDTMIQNADVNYIIFDSAGRILFSSHNYKFLDKYPRADEIRARLEQNETFTEYTNPNGKRSLAFFKPMKGYHDFKGFGWIFVAEYDEHNIFSGIYSLRDQIIFSCLAITVLGIFISLFLSRIILKPVKGLFEATKRIGDGNYTYHLNSYSNDEVGELTNAFNEMSKKINDSNLQILMQNEEMKQINQNLEQVILEREKAQVDLWEEKEKLSITLKSITDAVIATDENGKITLMNQTAESLTGYEFHKTENLKICDIFRISEKPDMNFSNILDILNKAENHRQFFEEVTLIGRNCNKCTISVSISSILKDNGDINGIVLVFRDITEKSRIEKQLIESENKFRNLFNSSLLGIFRSSIEGKFLDVNPALVKMFHYNSIQDMLDSVINIPDQIYENPLERKRIFDKLITGNGSGIFEIRCKTKEGKILIGNLNINLQKDENGKILNLEGFFEDITIRKNAEESFYKIFNSNPEWIDITTFEKGIHLNVNQAYCELFNYSQDEVIGKTSQELDVWVDYDIRTKIINIVREEGTLQNIEIKFRPHNGKPIVCLVSFEKILYNGEICLMAIGRDITERIVWEESLANEKERLSVTLRSIGDGVITTDVDGKVIMLNRIAERLTGWSQQEAAGKDLEEIFNIINSLTRQKCESPFKKVIDLNIITELENDTTLISKDGTERLIADSGSLIKDKESKIIGVVIVFRDITQKRKIEDELQKVQKIESIGVLAGGLAHDFNNILTSIVGSISLALLKPDIEHKDKYLKLAESASIRAKDLTYQLLTFAKGGDPVKKLTSLEKVIKTSASFAASGSNAEVLFEVEKNLWPVEIDEGQISQVIQNITINAIHAMPNGGKIFFKLENVEPGDRNELLPPGKFVSIHVIDTGEGISQENLKKIFDPYFTTKKKGSGLGLAISYSIIKKHNGSIDVRSQEGIGTEFTISLPASSDISSSQIELSESKIIKGKGYILIMDDEESIRFIMSDILKMLGYTVTGAADGTEAIKKYQEAKSNGSPFDLVIMDLTVPGGMGGKDTIQKLLKIDPFVTAIVSSGYSNDPVMGDFKNYGFKGAITKPYRVDEVNKIIKTVLNQN